MVMGLQVFSERAEDGTGQPRLDADAGEELMHVQPGVSIALGSHPPESPGNLYITSRRVVWLSDAEKDKGYAVDFLSVSLHAVSTDPEAYPLPCIYAQIETGCDEDEESGGSDSEQQEDFNLSKITEMRLVPSDPSQLDALFEIFCRCAELNPDIHEDGEEETEWFYGDEDIADDGAEEDPEWHFSENLANPIGFANGDHDLAHSVLQLQINDQRFDDAEEMEQAPRHEHQ
ncbi:ICln protein [Dioscorea alata]|uniref:ICln protein n=1 Tax=Dioscorea alata TaxID=55571 RepID=A0ACB7UV92_DIOAL|nr:ICln protein [Dioscorea alata]